MVTLIRVIGQLIDNFKLSRCCKIWNQEKIRVINNLMYIELKTGYSDDGPAWIGYVKTSKSKKILTFPQMRTNMIIEKECYR